MTLSGYKSLGITDFVWFGFYCICKGTWLFGRSVHKNAALPVTQKGQEALQTGKKNDDVTKFFTFFSNTTRTTDYVLALTLTTVKTLISLCYRSITYKILQCYGVLSKHIKTTASQDTSSKQEPYHTKKHKV